MEKVTHNSNLATCLHSTNAMSSVPPSKFRCVIPSVNSLTSLGHDRIRGLRQEGAIPILLGTTFQSYVALGKNRRKRKGVEIDGRQRFMWKRLNTVESAEGDAHEV